MAMRQQKMLKQASAQKPARKETTRVMATLTKELNRSVEKGMVALGNRIATRHDKYKQLVKGSTK